MVRRRLYGSHDTTEGEIPAMRSAAELGIAATTKISPLDVYICWYDPANPCGATGESRNSLPMTQAVVGMGWPNVTKAQGFLNLAELPRA